ncbi:MAG TPA: hypothetical protein VGT99_09005 [Gammaproteobacteria bacterium]|nr:hypothetical protein [Gammaproteobacteria bacterium]
MNAIHTPLHRIEIASLGALHQLLRASAIGLGMSVAAVLLLLFWSAGAMGELLDSLTKPTAA